MDRKPFPYGYQCPSEIDEVPLPDLTPTLLVALAREIVMDINELETILRHHKLSIPQFERIKRIPAFAQLLDSETAAWHSAKNTSERVKIEAAAAFEQLLPVLHARLTTKTENLNHVVAGAQLVADVAGIGKNREQAGGSNADKWSITINLGADKRLTLEANPNLPSSPANLGTLDLPTVERLSAVVKEPPPPGSGITATPRP